MPESTSPTPDPENLGQQTTREAVNQSGGVEVNANNISVGQDVVGRDKIVHIENYYSLPDRSGSKPPLESREGRSPAVDILLWLLWLLFAMLCAALAVIAGGWLWNITNTLFKWTFYLGGSGNEPYGIAAFVWGAIVAFAISAFAFIAGIWYIPQKQRSFRRISLTVALYTIFGGLGAVLFYGTGVRQWVESANLGYASQELSIAAAWSLILSVLMCLPLLVLPQRVTVLDKRRVWLQVPLAVILVILAVFLSLNIALPAMQIDQLRGFFAGVALRLGLFLGLLLSIVQELKPRSRMQSLWSNVLQPLVTQSHISSEPEQK
jgi:hypothetical protein